MVKEDQNQFLEWLLSKFSIIHRLAIISVIYHPYSWRNIPRGAYYVATKVGRYELDYENMFDFTREKTIKSVEKSLERLGLDYIDLIQVLPFFRHSNKFSCDNLQVHDLEFCHDFRQLVKFTIPALQELKKAGKVRYIGLTGYSLDSILRLISLLPEGEFM